MRKGYFACANVRNIENLSKFAFFRVYWPQNPPYSSTVENYNPNHSNVIHVTVFSHYSLFLFSYFDQSSLGDYASFTWYLKPRDLLQDFPFP